MGGAGVAVLKAGPPNTPDSCGQWLVHVELEGKTLFGWNHNETACNYGNYGQTHASMTMASSADYGHTWKIEGPIITGTDPPKDGKETGDSCGNVVRGQDGYDYAYCVHNGATHGTAVTHSPRAHLPPTRSWQMEKIFQRCVVRTWSRRQIKSDGRCWVSFLEHHRRDHRPQMAFGQLMLPRNWRPPPSKCLPIGQRKNGDAGLRYRSSLAVKHALAKAPGAGVPAHPEAEPLREGQEFRPMPVRPGSD
jgi:hypothetical protein